MKLNLDSSQVWWEMTLIHPEWPCSDLVTQHGLDLSLICLSTWTWNDLDLTWTHPKSLENWLGQVLCEFETWPHSTSMNKFKGTGSEPQTARATSIENCSTLFWSLMSLLQLSSCPASLMKSCSLIGCSPAFWPHLCWVETGSGVRWANCQTDGSGCRKK